MVSVALPNNDLPFLPPRPTIISLHFSAPLGSGEDKHIIERKAESDLGRVNA